MLRNFGALAALAALSGCGSIQVYKSDSLTDTLPGIPFYTKIPVVVQETKRLQRELLVTIQVSEVIGGKVGRSKHFPTAGAYRLSPEQVGDIEAILAPLRVAAEAKDENYDRILSLSTNAANLLAKLPKATVESKLVSNTRSVVAMLQEERYYINTRQPLIGSANSTYKLSADGTLTEATANVTDDTVKTLLALFPISAKISERWGLAKPADVSAKSEEVILNASVSEERTMYTLRKQRPTDLTPLKIADADSGAIELVSVEIVTGEAKAKPDTTSYKVQGTITPPKPDDAK